MGAGSIFVLFVFVVAAVVIAMMLLGVGGFAKKRTESEAEAPPETGDARPTHKVLDEKGNLVGTEYDDTPARRR